MAVARVTEIIASHPESFEGAIQEGVKRAAKTLRGITGLEVKALKVKIDEGRIVEYRVTMDVTFVLED